MTTTSKPNFPGVFVLTSTGVQVLSPPPNDTDIVIAGDSLWFLLPLDITGWPGLVGLAANEPVEVSHHVEQVETGTRFTLGPFVFATPGPGNLNPFDFITGPFTTSLNNGNGTFKTAVNDDDGVYRILTEFHFTANQFAKAISVFDDRILAITQP
jgi:hypothetical protein